MLKFPDGQHQRLANDVRTGAGLVDDQGRGGMCDALAAAVTEARSCEVLAQQGRYVEAFEACVSAVRSVESSDRVMRTAWFASHPPSKPPTPVR